MKKNILDLLEEENLEGIKNTIDKSELTSRDRYGDSPLHIAVLKRNIDIVDFLLEKSVDPNLQNNEGKTALHYAAEYNLVSISKLILSKNGRLDISDKYGNEPLWTAVFSASDGNLDKLELVKLFLQNGANKKHKNNASRSPKDMAQQVNFSPLVELLENL